ncbi:hypothetical protein GALMADRAFT_230765 [Galerina marginata CBS 339.88]|uniref:Uncharacterized protein n=1 Tax=Galerina marginata (strain CBS 339.88) TaxID=685588 RepID=A0A067SGV7_GALM3|nr:hypothetical protein GALMADRAFT_230765 [Galerina marginata CBS 339.88]
MASTSPVDPAPEGRDADSVSHTARSIVEPQQLNNHISQLKTDNEGYHPAVLPEPSLSASINYAHSENTDLRVCECALVSKSEPESPSLRHSKTESCSRCSRRVLHKSEEAHQITTGGPQAPLSQATDSEGRSGVIADGGDTEYLQLSPWLEKNLSWIGDSTAGRSEAQNNLEESDCS